MKLILKELPVYGADLPVDLQDMGKCQLTGLFRQVWNIDGKDRSVLTYITEGLHYNRPCLIVAPPSDMDAQSFLEHSGFVKFAEKNQVFVIVLEKDGECWDFKGKDADFMNRVYEKVQAREYYVVMQDCIYAVSYTHLDVYKRQP